MRFGGEKAHDAHCKLCGSLLYSVVSDGALVHVAMGTLVDDPSIRPSQHIFVGSKASWFTITDDLPQFEEFPVAGRIGGVCCRRGRRPRGFRLVDTRKMRRSTRAALSERGYIFGSERSKAKSQPSSACRICSS